MDAPEVKADKERRAKLYARDGCVTTNHCAGDKYPLEPGKQTLFMNAAVMSVRYHPMQLPWLVNIELPNASDSMLGI